MCSEHLKMAMVNLAPFSNVLCNKFPHLFFRLMLTLCLITNRILNNQLYQMSRESIHQKVSEEKVNSLFYLYLSIVSVMSGVLQKNFKQFSKKY